MTAQRWEYAEMARRSNAQVPPAIRKGLERLQRGRTCDRCQAARATRLRSTGAVMCAGCASLDSAERAITKFKTERRIRAAR